MKNTLQLPISVSNEQRRQNNQHCCEIIRWELREVTGVLVVWSIVVAILTTCHCYAAVPFLNAYIMTKARSK